VYPVELTAGTVMLRQFLPDDGSSLFKVYGDAEATRHLSFRAKERRASG
jgi:[ribosomal protein S5]-alanine N-acetyltransferase